MSIYQIRTYGLYELIKIAYHVLSDKDIYAEHLGIKYYLVGDCCNYLMSTCGKKLLFNIEYKGISGPLYDCVGRYSLIPFECEANISSLKDDETMLTHNIVYCRNEITNNKKLFKLGNLTVELSVFRITKLEINVQDHETINKFRLPHKFDCNYCNEGNIGVMISRDGTKMIRTLDRIPTYETCSIMLFGNPDLIMLDDDDNEIKINEETLLSQVAVFKVVSKYDSSSPVGTIEIILCI